MLDVRNQSFVIARLADYCDYRGRYRSDIDDPIVYMWEKLRELENPMYDLKQQLLMEAACGFFWKVHDGQATEGRLADFKQLLDGYLSPGDFADAAFHLADLGHLADKERMKTAVEFFKRLKAHRLLDEEDKPEEDRSKNWRRLVDDIYKRLQFDLLERVRRRRPLTARRLNVLIRRCRYNTAEYCTVFHFPIHPGDTFTPFIVPRVEALIAANQRFLRQLRYS
ncbi:MAG: hypothetical protein ABII00_14870 [Elusimicrobiota bacterium]